MKKRPGPSQEPAAFNIYVNNQKVRNKSDPPTTSL